MSLIKLKNNALDNLTSFEGSASLGDMVLVSSATASSSASIEFDLGSYKEYKFFFVNIHGTTTASLQLNFSTDNGSNYNVTKTSSSFLAEHTENNSYAAVGYRTTDDLAQSTSFQTLHKSSDYTNSDEGTSGFLHIFNPASTTFVKHFISRISSAGAARSHDHYTAGYANTTDDLTNIKFQMSSGNIDDGKILMFGLN